MIDTGLQGKSVLVTGGNTGIGAAIARAFAAQKARIILHYLDKPPSNLPEHCAHVVGGRAAAEALQTEIQNHGAQAVLVSANLLNQDAAIKIFSQTGGAVDVLVNNAAHCEEPDTILTVQATALERHFMVNAQAPTLLIAEFVRQYQLCGGQWGRIINISTDAARAFAGQIAYGASKAALEALTRSIAMELGPLGITVNTVAPGPVQTGWITPELEKQVMPRIPMRRLGRPEDIADAVVFLASHQAQWITGQIIQVAGGHAL